MKRTLSIVAASMLIGMAAPALEQQNSSEDNQQVVTNLYQRWTAAFNRQDLSELMTLYTEDAIRITPQGIFQGRDAIRKQLEGGLKAGAHDISSIPKIVQPSGDLIWNGGEWSAKVGSDRTVRGYYSDVITREGKLKFEAYNYTAPPANTTPAPAQQSTNK
jgi:ketosteroid isomerase-like protein